MMLSKSKQISWSWVPVGRRGCQCRWSQRCSRSLCRRCSLWSGSAHQAARSRTGPSRSPVELRQISLWVTLACCCLHCCPGTRSSGSLPWRPRQPRRTGSCRAWAPPPWAGSGRGPRPGWRPPAGSSTAGPAPPVQSSAAVRGPPLP